ncbi:5' nucleotidase, NT5C type [Flavobacterium subsaxonicum]|uniref:5'-nucleotidase n=1 Tax=Flavobacterium subsaxonicum WB 4.1-42 = DSM 21790 TaxID=1121898 RepID=A0A0A2MSS7_9FLAO|nr:5'-nucleotidase [Flavobacterium subsaxonicum]KGO91280.1 5'-nucleotidase [Flavobacterium subsaxonicum WB 4.1-42 = DSM 21790]
MKKLKTIAIDMDGVIADVEGQLLEWYRTKYGITLTRDEIKGRTEETLFPEKQVLREFLYTPGFFRTLPVIEGAVEALKELSRDFEIYIVSAAMEFPQSLFEKHQWLAEHFPFISWRNIVFCGDKSIIDTDFLIDDHCKNLDFCKGKALMFTAFHNVNQSHHQRVNNWEEIPALVRDLSQIRTKLKSVAPPVPENRPRW